MTDAKIDTVPETAKPAASTENKTIGLNVRLTPSGNSEQPVFSNFTMVNIAPGTAFIDFGFIEPGVLSALPQMMRDGTKLPEALNGHLSVRVAMGLDAMANLQQQLSRVIAGLNAAAKK